MPTCINGSEPGNQAILSNASTSSSYADNYLDSTPSASSTETNTSIDTYVSHNNDALHSMIEHDTPTNDDLDFIAEAPAEDE